MIIFIEKIDNYYMNIHVVEPIGFCPGVEKVIKKTREIIDDYPSSNIYLIGNVVHNDLVCDEFLQHKNVKILDNPQHDRLALVKSITTDNNIIIFSAHGTDFKAIDYAEAKGWKIYDLTCPYVMSILSKIKFAINHGYHVAYYGDKNHPEAIAAQALGGVRLTVYKNHDDLHHVLDMPYVQVVCQSTMDKQDYLATEPWFTEPAKIKFSNTICSSSAKRQRAIEELKQYDIVFVISDTQSHNGKALYEKLKQKQPKVIFVDPRTYKLTKEIITNKKDCAILSSSSVSKEQVDKFINELKALI